MIKDVAELENTTHIRYNSYNKVRTNYYGFITGGD